MNNELYHYKYLKYKKKYLKLKKKRLRGGGISKDTIDFIKKYSDEIEKFLSIFKAIMGPLAVVASAGLGGDTIIEMGTLGFEALLMIKDIIEFQEKMMVLKEKDYYWIIEDMFSFTFEGVENFQEQFEEFKTSIIEEIGEDEYAYVLGILNIPLQKLLSKVAGMVGNTVSTFVPNDGGATAVIIQNTIDTGINKGISTVITGMDKFYYMIPNMFKKVLENPENLAEKLTFLFKLVKKHSFKFLVMNPIYIGYKIWGKEFPTDVILDFMIENDLMIAEYVNKSFAFMYLFMNLIKEVQETNE